VYTIPSFAGDNPTYPGGVPVSDKKPWEGLTPTPGSGTQDDDKKPWEGLAPTPGQATGGGPGYYVSYLLSLPLRLLAEAILGFTGAIGFYSIEDLVFSNGQGSVNTAYVFSESEWQNIIMPWYTLMLTIASAGTVYQLVVLWVGYQAIAGSINPRRMVDMKETAWNVLIAILLMTQTPLIAKYIFEANAVFVEAIKSSLINRGLYDAAIKGTSISLLESTGNPLLDSIIMIAFAGLMLTLNFLYMVRKFVLGVLICVSPIVAWAWLTKKKTPVLLLMSELVSNGFMSLSHAIVLAFFASMIGHSGDGMFSTWWAKLFAISLLLPVSALLRRLVTGWLNLIGIDEEKYAQMAGTGLGGLVATAAIISGTLGGGKGIAGFGGSGGMPMPKAPDGLGPKAGGGGSLSMGTKAGKSITSFTGTGSKETAIKNASSWMESKPSLAMPDKMDSKTKPKIESFTKSVAPEDEKYGGKLPLSELEGAPTLGAMRGRIDAPIDENVFLGPAGPSTETLARKEAGYKEEENVHFVIPDPAKKAEMKNTPGAGGIKPGTEKYGGELPSKYGSPSVNELNRETNLQKDSNTFLGPAGPSSRTLYDSVKRPDEKPGEAEETAEAITKPTAKKRKWPTMEQVATAYNKALPALKVAGAVYGGVAGAAFGLSMGTHKSYIITGASLGSQTPQHIGNMINKRKKKKLSLDKPSIKNLPFKSS